ncbi:LacI family DNA-binding transcriptional regulator [Vagococcus acidifermentans]|uniref:LacI family transcriptional regulator n=1 Tax=Vagococcus acidifermentans TaxID=564710 RepID=A0A430AQK5_9ENTE|nr:LacI family DNA-binding transcriptional regulator [Vagococcus acidifermentans]RSU10263.1 LacI family transcriptional regulator [Vagococcus acidifermentans]
MATIIDVAKAAGVSKSTVSRVVSGNGYVSKESREKVLKAMADTGYIPNALARHFQSGETKTIGFLAQGYFDTLGVFLETFTQIARNYGYFIHLYFTGGDKQKELDALNLMKYKQIDGVFILTRSNDWETIAAYSMYGPIATWHRIDSPNIYSSYVDHYDGYVMSLNYLYDCGYRKIGHILGSAKNLNTQARLQAIDDFYREKKLALADAWVSTNSNFERSGQVIAKQWAEQDERCDALAFFSDDIAAQFMSSLQLLGYSVPDDVAVIGFDNSRLSELMHLTTVEYSLDKQAVNSFIYIYNALNDKKIPEEPLAVRLVKRLTVQEDFRGHA